MQYFTNTCIPELKLHSFGAIWKLFMTLKSLDSVRE